MRIFEFTASLPLDASSPTPGDVDRRKHAFGRGALRQTEDARAFVGRSGDVSVLAYGQNANN